MKNFTISKDALLSVTDFCAKGISSKPLIPAYGSLVVKIKNGTLYMKGYNYKFGLYDSTHITHGDDMDFAAVGHDFARIVRSMNGDIDFTFSAMNKTLTIKSGSSKYEIFAEEPIGYPFQDTVTAETVLTVDSAYLVGAIQTTAPSIKPDLLRPQMESMYIHRKDDAIKAAGVSMTALSVDGRIEGVSTSEVLDIQIMPYIFSAINGLSGEVVIKQNDKFSVFSDDNGRKVVQTKSAGVFPNYEAVIPTSYEYKMTVDRESMMESLNRIALVTNNQNYLIKLIFNGNILTITGEDMELGKRGEEVLEIDGDGEISIMVNGKQLQELINSRKIAKFDILLTTSNKPFVIEGEDNIISVLMPFVI